jgi:hypothetical protein
MVCPGTLFHMRQRGIPMHSYENRSQIRALADQLKLPNGCATHETGPMATTRMRLDLSGSESFGSLGTFSQTHMFRSQISPNAWQIRGPTRPRTCPRTRGGWPPAGSTAPARRRPRRRSERFGRSAPAPRPETAEKSGPAPCAPIQKPRTQWIFTGETVRNAEGA